jgi:hypothetical protein
MSNSRAPLRGGTLVASFALEGKIMSTESPDFDAYAVVLADLRAKRDQIDAAIQAIETLRASVGPAPAPQAAPLPNQTSQLDAGAFLGMSIPDATKKLLSIKKQALNNAVIVTELKSGGMALKSADPLNTVGAVLSRRFHDVGDIVRVDRGTWGLKEWYPGRSFGKKENGVKTASEPTSPEQPSAQPQSAVEE